MNNKGFALTSIIYTLIVLFLMIMLLVLSNLASRKVVLDKIKNDVKNKLDQGPLTGEKLTAKALQYQNANTDCTNVQCALDELFSQLSS